VRTFFKLLAQLAVVVVVSFLGGHGLAATQGQPVPMLGVGVLTAVLALLAYAGLVRLTERRPVTELALRSAVPGLGLGTVLGIVVFGLVIIDIYFLGYYQVHGQGSTTAAVGLFGFMAAATATEELMFRGVLFRIIERRTGTWLAMLLTGLLFGAYHLINPDASVWGAVAIVLEAGGMLTAAYIATRRLWVPIGLHLGWNFAAAGIFSTVVSGNGSNQGLLRATMSGPTLITGGDFGPEGSLYSILFCGLTAIGFLIVAHRRGRIVPRRARIVRVDAAATLPQ